MSTLTVRLPDSTAERLKSLARSRGLSVNKLMAEMSTQALAIWDTESRFRLMATQASIPQALAILARLDNAPPPTLNRLRLGKSQYHFADYFALWCGQV
ncbi:MAG: CopG family transcriptional regulator [Sulfuriferula sp.]